MNGQVDGNGYNPWPYFRFSGKLRPFPVTPKRNVPSTIQHPDYAERDDGRPLSELAMRGTSNIKILSDEEIEGLRVACKVSPLFDWICDYIYMSSIYFSIILFLTVQLAREVLDEAAKVIGVGVTTEEVDAVVHEACIERDCYPSPLNYYCFPKSCCTSVNEVICHGIPDMRPLVNGDICNVDVTVYHGGYHGDLNETFLIGEVSPEAKKLVKTTWECLQKSIEESKV